MIPLPAKSPFSGGDIIVTRFYCPETDVSVEGRFSVTAPFAQLTPEQLEFVELFVRSEGKISRMEGELGMSYPTIRNRLRDIVRTMGYEPGQEELQKLSEDERRKILHDLDEGNVTFDEAMQLLRAEDGKGAQR